MTTVTKYRITIETESCAQDGRCREEAPKTFDIDEDGKAFVIDPEGDPPEYIRQAAKKCPLQAITLHDVDTGELVYPLS